MSEQHFFSDSVLACWMHVVPISYCVVTCIYVAIICCTRAYLLLHDEITLNLIELIVDHRSAWQNGLVTMASTMFCMLDVFDAFCQPQPSLSAAL
eukprot:scaffold291143_cov44-Prasinocladus_malaysianus.AAC.2